MPDKEWQKYRAVKLDVHQTMVRAPHSPQLGAPTPGVLVYMRRVQKKGYFIWLSCAGFEDNPAFQKEVIAWLRAHNIDPHGVGFLHDTHYIIDISDRAITFRGDWDAMWAETLNRMDVLEETHETAGQKPRPVTLSAEGEGPGAPPPLAKAS